MLSITDPDIEMMTWRCLAPESIFSLMLCAVVEVCGG